MFLLGVAAVTMLALLPGQADARALGHAKVADASPSSGGKTEEKTQVVQVKKEVKKSMKVIKDLEADKNFDALKAAFEGLKGKGLEGMDGWDAITDDGAKAAAAKDIDGVQKACKSCHTTFKKKFKDAPES